MIKNYFNIKIPALILLSCLWISISILTGCENNPGDLGLHLSVNDTLGTIVLDSQKDTMPISSKTFLKYVNTSSSLNLFVGKYQDYISKGLLKFNGIINSYDSATVLSATLKLKFNNYALQDSNGVTSFNIYRINKNYDFDTVTYDQFSNSDIGSNVLGSYSGILHDTVRISIPFDNQTITDWLKYAYDTNYANKNYGLILVPNNNSSNLKAFYTYSAGNSDYIPTIIAVVTKNGTVDTLTLNTTQSVSLNYAPVSLIPKTEIFLQNGVAFRDIIKFDLSKLPSKVIINQAILTLSLDRAKSFISNTGNVDVRLVANMITDSVALMNDGINYYSSQPDSSTYTITMNIAFQKWNYGTSPNMGILIRNIYDYTNLDRYVFYSCNYPDINKRPRLKIRYTVRR